MLMTPARTIREARELIDQMIPLLQDREHTERIELVRDDLRAIRGATDNGIRVSVDHVHLEEMQAVVGQVCLGGGLGIEHHELAADLCTAMREIGLQAVESVIG